MATWFITGSSTGIGRALAEQLLAADHDVVVTARDTSSIADLADRYGERALVVALDVTDAAQRDAAITAAEERFGGIDVLVNNAGYGYRAAVEEGDPGDVAALFDTHFFGPVELIKGVLPGMRARRSGAIVNVSSTAVRQPAPGSGYYAAAKASLGWLSQSLRREVAPLGITVLIVEPGPFRTDFNGRSLTQSSQAIDDYESTVGPRRVQNDHSHGTQAGDPVRAAAAIITAVQSAETPLHLLLGTQALASFDQSLADLKRDRNAWEAVSRSADFPLEDA